jgi:hypothetical protein
VPNGKRHWNQSGREASLVRNGSEKLLVRINARAAELEDCRMRLGLLHDSSNRFRNIFHIGRLQSGQAAAEHRIDRKLAEEPEDVARNASSGPNITAGRTKSASANAARTASSPSPRFRM